VRLLDAVDEVDGHPEGAAYSRYAGARPGAVAAARRFAVSS
jgi:hypothetical protein